MRRLVAIPIKTGVAVGLWTLAALTVAAEVRQPGFWSEKVDALRGRKLNPIQAHASDSPRRRGDADINAASASSNTHSEGSLGNAGRSSAINIPEPEANALPAARQPSQAPDAVPSTKNQDPHTRLIVISIPDRQLAILEDGVLVKTYPVAVGAKGSPSPEGEYTIINHAANPTYRHGDVEIAPGKDNPLGTRWMGLSLKGYGIHGTNVQRTVGKAVSHGCFRMKKKDVEELYTQVKVGDSVSIRGQRDEFTAQVFGAPAAIATGSDDPERETGSAASSVVTAAEEQ